MNVFLLLSLGVASAFVAAKTPTGSPRRPVWTLLSVLCLAGSAWMWLVPKENQPPAKSAAPDSPLASATQPVAAPSNPEFVGAEACRRCHEDQFSSWHDSYHRTMTQRATPEAIVAPFDDVVLSSRGREFHLHRDDNEFWVEMPDPVLEWQLGVRASQGEAITSEQITAAVTSRPVRLPIVMTTGSHLHQTYWVPGPKNMLLQLPWVYHIEHERWVPRYDSFLAPPREEAFFNIWNVTCVMCHATAGVPGQDDVARVLRTEGELGIACEACHGPGGEHIAAHTQPLSVSERPGDQREADPTIVNPARLDHVRMSHVCGQCHSYFHRSPEQYQRWLTEGSTYRPGDDLEDHRLLLRYDPEGHTEWIRNLIAQKPEMFAHQYWPDGTARTGGRELSGLIESACFLEGEMSCISCHSMHNSDPADQLAKGMETNEACTQCHSDERFVTNVTEHTHHPADSSGSLCYNCHMPHTTYVLMGAVRSHRIVAPEVVTGVRGARPNACNLCHLDKTLDWTSEHLAEWHGLPRVEVSEEEKTTAASLLWLLAGDATQRLIAAWSMGWKPAQEASGADWAQPFLAVLLGDPYSAIRDIAHRSLKTYTGYDDVEFDFLADPEHFKAVASRVQDRWAAESKKPSNSELLISGEGHIDRQRRQALLKKRDNRQIQISE